MAQAHVGGRQRRLLAQRQLIFPDALFRPSGGQHQFAQPHPRQRVHAVQADGMKVGALGLIPPAGGLQRLTQRHPGRAHLRRHGQRRAGHLHRRFRLAAGQGHQAHAHQRVRIARVLGQHALVAERNLAEPAGQSSPRVPPRTLLRTRLRVLRRACLRACTACLCRHTVGKSPRRFAHGKNPCETPGSIASTWTLGRSCPVLNRKTGKMRDLQWKFSVFWLVQFRNRTARTAWFTSGRHGLRSACGIHRRNHRTGRQGREALKRPPFL